ncbi:MAG: hypothetical protein LUG44_07820 [Clostridiales bacterium]|nr:hypothetical protein [Clostridiales bacterium]
MILVNIFFQETNQEYDFKLMETLPLGQVTEEIVEMIAQKEHLALKRDPGLFLLCDKTRERVLHPMTTLASNAVHSGDSLLLL